MALREGKAKLAARAALRVLSASASGPTISQSFQLSGGAIYKTKEAS